MHPVNLINMNWNWQVPVVCIGFNIAAQIFTNTLLINNTRENSTTEKISAQIVSLIIGIALATVIAKPLASYWVIILTPKLIIQMTAAQAVVQLVYHLAFSPKELPDVKHLVTYYDTKWDSTKKEYVGIVYNPENLKKRFSLCGKQFSPQIDLQKNHGYIEKKEIPKGSKIFVRADLHGDLKSLIENLKAMQKEGFLDENFKCKPNSYMVFCGDYMDRGNYSLEVAEILATLKLENPHQVFLVRGNHEYSEMNQSYKGNNDLFFQDFLTKHTEHLNKFYETMPLTLYLGEEGGEFVQFTHGVFELDIDPVNMLESKNPKTNRMVIPKAPRLFSTRVQKLAETVDSESPQKLTKMQIAARRVMKLKKQEKNPSDWTIYNWGDVHEKKYSSLGNPALRVWNICPQDIKQAFRLMGGVRKVKLLFRGHQHVFQHGIDKKGKIVVTTLPIGMDCAYYVRESLFQEQLDRAYILEVSHKVKNWKKRAFLRKRGETEVTITTSHSIHSKAV